MIALIQSLMRALKPRELRILEKLSDKSGWSATRLGQILKAPKGNILARCLQPMEKMNVIFKEFARKTESNQNEIPYYIKEDLDIFNSIVNQLVKNEILIEGHKQFFASEYTNNIVKKFGFSSVYNILQKNILQSEFKNAALKSLLNLSATRADYTEFAKELKTRISEFVPDVDEDHGSKEIQLKEELRKIHEQLRPKNIDYLDILGSFEKAQAVLFYRQNIHTSVKEGLDNLAEKSVITQGIKDFLIRDNYLSPLTSYPINGSLTLLISQSFQRIYNEAYLLNEDGLDLLSYRAAAIYKCFPDILFELFRFDPPEKKHIESITKQMIFYWNVASTRFDYCYYFAERCTQKPGNYHLASDGFSYDIIDLDNGTRLLPESATRSILVKGSTPRLFVPDGPFQFDIELMENPFDCLRPCVTFRDIGINDDFILFEEILAKL
jgi:hypothetical protein